MGFHLIQLSSSNTLPPLWVSLQGSCKATRKKGSFPRCFTPNFQRHPSINFSFCCGFMFFGSGNHLCLHTTFMLHIGFWRLYPNGGGARESVHGGAHECRVESLGWTCRNKELLSWQAPAEVHLDREMDEGVWPHTYFSSLSLPSHPFNPVDLAVRGHFSYYSLWNKSLWIYSITRERRCPLMHH